MRHHTLREGHVSRNQRCGARGEPAIPTRALAREHRPRRPASPQSQNTRRGKNSTLAPTGSGQLRHPAEQLLPGRAPTAAAQCTSAQTRKVRRHPQASFPLRAPTGGFRSGLQLRHSGGRGKRMAVYSRKKASVGSTPVILASGLEAARDARLSLSQNQNQPTKRKGVERREVFSNCAAFTNNKADLTCSIIRNEVVAKKCFNGNGKSSSFYNFEWTLVTEAHV